MGEGLRSTWRMGTSGPRGASQDRTYSRIVGDGGTLPGQQEQGHHAASKGVSASPASSLEPLGWCCRGSHITDIPATSLLHPPATLVP